MSNVQGQISELIFASNGGFRIASGQRTFQNRGTSLWNELQPALKLSQSHGDGVQALTQAKAS